MAEGRVVLVTRPEGQGEALCEQIRRRGHRACQQPLIEIEARPLSAVERQQVMELDRYQHLIFISANAVRLGMEQLEAVWPQWPLGLHWYAIGAATAATLSAHGVAALHPDEGMTSEALLALPSLQQPRGQRVLIVKGEGGRQTLREALAQRGALVDELPCYRRGCPQLAPGVLAARLAQWQVDTLCISSGEGLDNLLRLLSPEETTNLRDTCLLVPSPRVADMAMAAGFARVYTADDASDGAMLRALEQLPVQGD